MQLLNVSIASYFAFTLMIAGLAKVDYPHTLAGTLRTMHWIPDAFVQPLVKIISWGEIVVALWLLSGIVTVPAAAINLMLFVGFLSFKILVAHRKLMTDCGCFGETYRRKIDSVSIVVAVIQVGLAAIYLWLVSRVELGSSTVNLVAFVTFAGFSCVVYWRIVQRRKLLADVTHRAHQNDVNCGHGR